MTNQNWLAKDSTFVADALKIRFYPIAIKGGKGVRLIDYHGKEYLDLSAGWAVANIGYGHPKMAQSLKQQYETLSFSTNITIPDEQMIQLAEKLTELVPGSFAKKVWF